MKVLRSEFIYFFALFFFSPLHVFKSLWCVGGVKLSVIECLFLVLLQPLHSEARRPKKKKYQKIEEVKIEEEEEEEGVS